MRTMPLALRLAALGLALAPVPLCAQQRPEATQNPIMEAAQRAFDALPEPARKSIQDDLIWGSIFNATVSGGFGPRTFDAILQFERRMKLRPDGILEDDERAALADAAKKARAAVKFELVTDKATGTALGLPLALLPKREALPIGTMWSSKDEALSIRTGLAPGGADDLPRAFEGTLSIQAPGRKVTYKLLRPDFFVVSGEVGTRTFYTRTAVGKGNLVSYTILYPTAQAKSFERVMVALANNFHPIAGASAVASATTSSSQPVMANTTSSSPGTLQPGLILTGFVSGPGRVVTGALAGACSDLKINGKPARMSGGINPVGVSLLTAETGQAPALGFSLAAPSDAAVLVGFINEGRKATLSVSSATMVPAGKARRIEAPLHAEGGGSLALDRSGNLIGLVQSPRQSPRLIAGIVPAISHGLVAGAELATVAGLSPAPAATAPLSAGAIAARVAPSLVAIECGQPVQLAK